MMDPDDVRRLITSGEGQMIEFKKSFSETREGIESLCAFANSRGGHVLFGVVEQGGPGTAIGVQFVAYAPDSSRLLIQRGADSPSIWISRPDGSGPSKLVDGVALFGSGSLAPWRPVDVSR